MLLEIAYLEIKFSEEHFWAGGALEPLHARVHFHVLVQICPLSEGELTVCLRARIGSLICVDTQVVKEIMPFPKAFAAVFVIAF